MPSAEASRGRCKLLVEMATGTGKIRTAVAFIKRLFEAGIVTRVLFLVECPALPRQVEDAFHRPSQGTIPVICYVPGCGFDRPKRITVANFQTMIAEYRTLSPGYQSRVATFACRVNPAIAQPHQLFRQLASLFP